MNKLPNSTHKKQGSCQSMSTCRVTKKGVELSLSPDRISVYACSISLTAEKEELGAIGINFPWRNTKQCPKRLRFF